MSDLTKQKQSLLLRIRRAQVISFHISREMWARMEVTVEMCVKQHEETMRWESLRVMLGGLRA